MNSSNLGWLELKFLEKYATLWPDGEELFKCSVQIKSYLKRMKRHNENDVAYLFHTSKLLKNLKSTCTGKISVPFDIHRDNGTNPLKRRNLVARLQWGTHTLLRTKYPTTEFWYFAASKAAGLGVKENIHLHLALILRMH